MGRLHCIILFTPEMERQKAFYEQKLGLGVTHDSPEWVGFALRGASLALHAAPAGAAPELQLAISAVPLEARVEALKARGVVFEGGIEDAPTCRLARLLDPEGNRIQLVEPKGAETEGHWPRLSRAIVAATKFASTAHFYRDVLGLRAAEEEDGRVEFATGSTRLTIQDRESANSLPLHAEQKIAFAFEDDEFDAWADELRGRGVSFAAAPMEGEFGVQAEVEDADGWFVVLHGPPPEEPFEDELAEGYVDDDEPQQRTQMIRKPGETSGESTKKRLTAAKLARQTSERAATKSFETPRTPREPETGGFGGGGARPDRGGFGGPRPAGPPRPGGYGGAPRPGGPSGPPRPSGPRPGGYGGGGPRPGGSGGSSGPRPGGYGGGGPRPGGPGGSGGPRPGGSGPRPGGPPRGGSGGSGGTGGRE